MTSNLYRLVAKHVPIEKLLSHLQLFVDSRGFLLCPFHKEKTPSLKVYGDQKGWYCFGCHKGGDSISFYAAYKKIRRRKAVDGLAKIFGIAGKKLSFERRKKNHTYDVLRSWEREICSSSLLRIFATTGDLRASLYSAWFGHCCALLDQAEFFIKSGDSYGTLKKIGIEITDFLDWTEGVYRDEHGDAENDHAIASMEQEEIGVRS